MKPQQEYNHTLEKLTIRVEREDSKPNALDAAYKLHLRILICKIVGARLLMEQNHL